MSAHNIPGSLALFLATRQKRLNYLRTAFDPKSVTPTEAKEIQEMLSTYGMMMSKLTKATSDIERKELEERIFTIDRKLTSLFELRRLHTGKLRPVGAYSTAVDKPRHAPLTDGH